ncbi:hypothetical protein [Spongiactinospora sp. TRM90649]|uniref:hypothetical protein n=1 Tax=Spongiactinospora sp. TRM90649 TaxID=3031114 RepID=UPI0023F923EF|nr:hypothetical protein [Spongiactinospora sp. TRM90649]MDF5759140.1 hypothetical protein [Spongiactinospora sp. TRM90649]
MEFVDLLLWLAGLWVLTSVVGGLRTAFDTAWRHVAGPFAMGLVGTSFLLSAGVIAAVDFPDAQQLLPARSLRIKKDFRPT